MTKGIYIIKNICNNKVYVGRSTNIENRYNMHLSVLRRGKGYKELQKDYNTFGEKSFYYEVLEVIEDVDKLKEREDFYIDKYDAIYNGYNTRRNFPINTKSITIPVSEEHYDFINERFGKNSVQKTRFLREIVEREIERIK